MNLSKQSVEPFGPVSGLTFGNGVKASFTYDKDYRLTDISAKGSRENIQNLTMAYDGVNDITSIMNLGNRRDKNDHRKDTRDQSFTYDADYRLLTATGPYGAETFAYDADGNRVKETLPGRTRLYTYAGTSNQLATIDGEEDHTFTYTANGDLAKETGSDDKTFTYDARNRNSALGERASKDTREGRTTSSTTNRET